MSQNTREYEAAKSIIEQLNSQGCVALLAGGCVRDRLLGKTPKDHDVATGATPEQVCKLFRRTKKVGAKFGVVLVSLKGHDIEVATFRTDGKYHDGRHPESVVFSDAKHDAQRRDFTINGMFFDPIKSELVDYVGGQTDLDARLVRCIGDPVQRFEEDHLRLLRAVRFAAALDFVIESRTLAAMRQHASRIATISPERIRGELAHMLTSANRSRAWNLLCEATLTDHLVQGVCWNSSHQHRVFAVLSELPNETSFALGLAAVFSTIGPKEAPRASKALRCSNEEIGSVRLLLEQADQLGHADELELADIKIMLASHHFEEACALAVAQMRVDGVSLAPIKTVRERATGIPSEKVAPPPLLDGAFLLKQKIPQGPIYRNVLAAVYREQLNERVETVAEAQAWGVKLVDREMQ